MACLGLGWIGGPIEDEFGTDPPEIEPDGPDKFIVLDGISIAAVNQQLKLQLASVEAETLSALSVEKTGQVLKVGGRIELDGVVAEVLDVKDSRASRISMELKQSTSGET